jgi:hypothetical protein
MHRFLLRLIRYVQVTDKTGAPTSGGVLRSPVGGLILWPTGRPALSRGEGAPSRSLGAESLVAGVGVLRTRREPLVGPGRQDAVYLKGGFSGRASLQARPNV